jgi:glucose/arabinose dehydrogenase
MRHKAVVAALAAFMVIGMVLPALAAELPPGGSFVDDDDSVHEGNIEAIFAAGITRGCNPPVNDRFCPDDPVTRGQMAAFIVRAQSLPASDDDVFADDDDSEFEADIQALAAEGITRGCNPPANTNFCPDSSITRGEMAAFLVRAYDYPASDTDRFTDDDSSEFEGEIQALAAAGVTLGCNPPANDRYCPDDPVTREQMASFLARAEGLDPIEPPDRPTINLDEVASGLTRPVYATAPTGDDRLFIVQKDGVIKILDGGTVVSEPFLDISDDVSEAGSEMGLLSMAFHPDYASNGRFFVYYSRAGGSGNHTSVVSEFTVSSDPNVADTTENEIITVSQPFENHNGGHILFGPDGMLYIALGDGGDGGDPLNHGQDTSTLLGSILRIDVDGDDPYEVPADNPFVGSAGADEIWLYGVRNPWRIWFDDGLLYVADVGQNSWEEVSVVDAGEGGLNLGWRVMEGDHCFNPSSGCNTSGKVRPLVEHSHVSGSCSITGGVVYRGSELTELRGRYLYGDLCAGDVRTILTDGTALLEQGDLTDDIGEVAGLWSFGVDGNGEVYLLQGSAGTVNKLTAG